MIILGVLIVLKSFNIVDQIIFFTGWWTLFIIVPAAINLIFNNNRVNDASLLVVGVSLYCAANEYITYNNVFAIALCLLLINVAVAIMRGQGKRKRVSEHPDGNYVGCFGGFKEKLNSFSGGNAIAIFGGVDLDLRDIVFTEDVYLTAIAIFGGVDIKVNDNINIVSSTINILGGTENKQQPIAGNKTLYIDGCTIFGGIDIKR